MSIALNLALVVGAILLLLGVMAVVKASAAAYGLGPEMQRKLIHVATGLFAVILPLVFPERWPILVLVGLSLIVLLVLRLPMLKSGFAASLHGVERRSHGEIYLILAVGFLAFRSEGQPVVYVLPLLVLTLSDAAAALVGVGYGKRKLELDDGVKSVEGVVAFFMTTCVIALIALLLMTDAPRLNVILLSLMIAAFGAMVEVNSWKGLDNLFIPVGLHLFLVSRLNAPPLELVILAGGFFTAAVAMLVVAPVLKISRQAAKAATVLIFLVCSVTALHNAILPVIAILAHLAARRRMPCASPHPDLDLLGTVALVALLWLFTGEVFGATAIDLFNLTFATAAVILLALAGPKPVAVVLGVAVGALLLLMIRWNPPEAHWHSDLLPWAAVAMIVGTALAFARPLWFDHHRSLRVFALALIAPALLYVIERPV